MSSEAVAALTAFCVDNPELDQLEAMLAEFNLFEAAGLTNQEIRHSRFLSFLLDPKGAHGLGDLFVTRLLQAAVHGRPPDEVGVTALDLELMDLSDLQVACEVKSIDILLLSSVNQFAVVIENKVGTGEHSNQLSRYLKAVEAMKPGRRTLPVLLSPLGVEPSDSRYFAVSYESVAAILRSLIDSRRASLGSDVALALTHYERLLRRYVVTDSELNVLCDKIIEKHRKALSVLFERFGDPKAFPKKWLADYLVSHGFQRDRYRFIPGKWLEWVPKNDSGEWMLYFFIEVDQKKLSLLLEVGPGPESFRRQLVQGARAYGKPFKVGTKETETYTRIRRCELVQVSTPEDWYGEDWQERATLGVLGLSQGGFEGMGNILRKSLETGDGNE
jgi:hypothetical protein